MQTEKRFNYFSLYNALSDTCYITIFFSNLGAMHTKNVDGQLHGLYLEALCDGLDNALNPYRYVSISFLNPYTIKS